MDRENSSTNNNSRIRELISRLDTEHRLSLSEYEEVLKNRTEEDEKFAQELAVKWRKKIYGNGVYTRGLIEFTNYCKIIFRDYLLTLKRNSTISPSSIT